MGECRRIAGLELADGFHVDAREGPQTQGLGESWTESVIPAVRVPVAEHEDAHAILSFSDHLRPDRSLCELSRGGVRFFRAEALQLQGKGHGRES